MRRFLATALALVLATMALAAQKVWDGTKWVARSLSGVPTPPSSALEEAFDDVVADARPVTTSVAPAAESVTPSAPAPKAETAAAALATADVVELDPILAKGRVAHAFACALATQDEEPSTEGLDEGEIAWLNSLCHVEMMAIYRAGPMRTGAHMAGIKTVEGLPLCPTQAEYTHILGQAARITPRQREEIREYNDTLDATFQDMISAPGFELKCGV